MLLTEMAHEMISNIQNWYPLVIGKTPYTEMFDEFPNYGHIKINLMGNALLKDIDKQTDIMKCFAW